jgi:XTP/dITP diphosphohydrolase
MVTSGERRVLVCASANPDKVNEIERILGDLVALSPRPSFVAEVVEDAGTLVGNARLKATTIRDATQRSAVADDTGLFVAALPDELGVETAHYAADRANFAADPYGANRRKLLEALGASPDQESRRAEFVTVVLVAWSDGSETIVEGRCAGHIATHERGAHGWGFDPLFVPDEGDGRTFAEMTDDDKHALSHRGRAFRALADVLRR